VKSKPLPSGLLVGILIAAGVLVLGQTAGPAEGVREKESSSGPRGGGAATVPASAAAPPVADAIALDPVTPPEEPAPDDCAIWYGTIDRFALSLEQWAAASTSVVRATVEDIGDTQWNTADGKAPAGRKAESSDLMRLIQLAPGDTLKGQLSSTIAWIPGGTIGCLTYLIDEYAVTVGQEYLFFMRDLDPATGLKGALRARLMWPIEADGTVSTPAEGRLSIVEIAKRIVGR
jgi:hypothetical protein